MRATTQTGEPIPDALIERAAARAPLQPGLRDGALHRVGAGRHGGARATRRDAGRRRRLRARRARAARPAAGRRPEPPAAALPAPVLRLGLRRRLLRLPVGRGARRRRLRGLRRGRRSVRRGGRASGCVRFIYSSGNSIEPGAAYRAFRGRAPTPEPMLRQRGLLEATARLSRRARARRPASAPSREALRQRGEEDARSRSAWSSSRRSRRASAALDVLGHRVGRQRDAAGSRAVRGVGAQAAQHLEAVEVGQLQVDQDEVGPQRLRARDAGARRSPRTTIARPATRRRPAPRRAAR